MQLTESEIKQRLVELRNLRMLYDKAKNRIVLLETENQALKVRIKELEANDRDKSAKLEALSFQLEQIRIKVFGKKHIAERMSRANIRPARNSGSYIRPTPGHITEAKRHPVTSCVHCSRKLSHKRVRVFFEEDIPLPIQKTVIRHCVEVGYCKLCRRQSSGYPIPSKTTALGDNVKKYVCTLSIASRLSHSQIREHLQDVFALDLSIGEIGNMLHAEADTLRPHYERLKRSVTKQRAAHYDETGWPVVKEEHGTFAWVAAGTENNDAAFMLGKSRGKGNITELGTAGLAITDDYGAYRNTFPEQQLCWAHPHRKLRDLAESAAIPQRQREPCRSAYEQFSSLYRRIRTSLAKRFSPYLKRKFQADFDAAANIRTLDPAPLANIKAALQKNKDKYFTFLRHPGIPVDNNKAERALRHLVLKRKISFGSKTQRGAETTSILASIIMSLKWNDPDNWFQKYLKLGI